MQDDEAYDRAMKEERGNKNPSGVAILFEEYQKLYKVFEEVLVEHVPLAELREFYRQQAGVASKMKPE